MRPTLLPDALNSEMKQLQTPNQIIMRMNRLATLVAATIILNASLAFADDSLFITLPGETYVETAGNAGTPSTQTVGTAFAVKIHALTDTVNFTTDTSF